jgi:hypothetical protein
VRIGKNEEHRACSSLEQPARGGTRRLTMISGDFDNFAQGYKTLLDRALEMSGDTAEYSCGYKAR